MTAGKKETADDEKRSIWEQPRVPGVSFAQVPRRYSINANLIFKWLRDPWFSPTDAPSPEAIWWDDPRYVFPFERLFKQLNVRPFCCSFIDIYSWETTRGTGLDRIEEFEVLISQNADAAALKFVFDHAQVLGRVSSLNGDPSLKLDLCELLFVVGNRSAIGSSKL